MTDSDRGRRRRARTLTADRRTGARGHFHMAWDLIYRGLRALGVRANSFYTTVGVFLIIGVVIAVAGTMAFAEVGEWVQKGITQRFDVAVLQWMHQHQSKLLTEAAVELTYLGTGTVVMMIVAVAA